MIIRAETTEHRFSVRGLNELAFHRPYEAALVDALRLGFTLAKLKGLRCEYYIPDEVFMVAELEPGALGGRQGLGKHHPEFSRV